MSGVWEICCITFIRFFIPSCYNVLYIDSFFSLVRALPEENLKSTRKIYQCYFYPLRRHCGFRGRWFPCNDALPGAGVAARGHTSHNRWWTPSETHVPGIGSSASDSGLPRCSLSPGHPWGCLFPLSPGIMGGLWWQVWVPLFNSLMPGSCSVHHGFVLFS